MNTPPAGTGQVSRFLSASIAGLEWVSCALLVAMLALTFVDVVCRYLFAQPVFGAPEIMSALLALSIFAGLGITNARDDHIVLELIDQRIRQRIGRSYDVVIQGFSILCMALVAVVLAMSAAEAWQYDARSYVLAIPSWITLAAIAGLAGFSVALQIAGVALRWGDARPRRGHHG